MSENTDSGSTGSENVGPEGSATPSPSAQESTQSSQESSLISQANAVAARMEAANKKAEEIMKRQEAMQVRQTLNGQSDSNVQKKEESDKEYSERILKGDLSE